MTRLSTKFKNTSSVGFAIWIFVSCGFSEANEFRSPQDRAIVSDVLHFFGRECGLKSANEADIVKRLEIEADRARRKRDPDVEKCFTQYFSQITGVYYLYQKICSDVSSNGSAITDTRMARQLIDVSKYQTGIRPHQAALNECLNYVPGRRGKAFVVPLPGAEIDVAILQNQIDSIRVRPGYQPTVEPFR